MAAAIRRLLPEERLVYFGDTLHTPYGDKSEETIQKYSEQITRFLLSQDCKAIVIACNTASALAYKFLKEKFPETLILNVVDPVVNYVGSHLHSKVGIIATRATIKSGIYRKTLRRLNPKLNVVSAPTPLLVGIVEEGFAGTQVSAGAIETYLGSKKFSDVSSLILGCTHFPLLQKEIEQFFQGRAEVVDSPELVARHLKSQLAAENLLAQSHDAADHFYVSEKTAGFKKTAKLFFGKDLKLEEKVLAERATHSQPTV